MQYCALVTILQCHCTSDFDPPRRRCPEWDPFGRAKDVSIFLELSLDLGLVNYLQYGAVLFP